MSTFRRRLTLWQILPTGTEGIGLKAVAERLAVSKTTAQRDVDALSSAGVPVVELRRGQQILYAVVQAAPTPAPLGAGERAAVAAARAALLPYRSTAVFGDFEGARAKLGGDAHSGLFGTTGAAGATSAAPSVLDTLVEGVLGSRRAVIAYRARGADGPREYAIEPYAFLLHQGLLYLHARVPPHRSPATFALHLVDAAKLTAETFERRRWRRTGFGIYEEAPVDVEVRFDAGVAAFIREREWHPTQKLARRRDGSLVFRATLSGKHEFVGWVLGWGPGAELVRPRAWREEVLRRARGMARRHRRAFRPDERSSRANPRRSTLAASSR